MSETIPVAGGAKTPWHFWAVAVVAALWNAYGCFDYVMTATENAAYLAPYTPEQVEYFTTLPAWYVAFWAIGVWSALAASVLLLLRRALAVWVFAASFAAVVITFIASLAAPAPEGVLGPATYVVTAIVWAVAIFEIWYAWTMKKRGVLR